MPFAPFSVVYMLCWEHVFSCGSVLFFLFFVFFVFSRRPQMFDVQKNVH